MSGYLLQGPAAGASIGHSSGLSSEEEPSPNSTRYIPTSVLGADRAVKVTSRGAEPLSGVATNLSFASANAESLPNISIRATTANAPTKPRDIVLLLIDCRKLFDIKTNT